VKSLAPAKTLRCAIYTRKSTEQGLEQEFNSLDNQREAAEAYIKSQAHEGWRLAPEAYDDGGYSGGSHIASQLGRFRPVPELAGYQTVLPNVYTCSANVHSGSGIGRGSSYNCWKQIASDLQIDPNAEVRVPDATPAAEPADTVGALS